jgi:hypothetical protein
MNRTSIALLLATVVVATGCKKEPEAPAAPSLAKVMPRIPLPPDGQTLTAESGTDATQIIVVSPHPVDSVLAYYRDLLAAAPYRLLSESKTADGTVFYAEADGPSLWITVMKNGEAGSQVVIAGAGTDTTRAPKPRKGLEPLAPTSGG